MKPILAAAALAFAVSPAFAEEHGHHWGYSGETGPTHWGKMEKESEACSLGKHQSPIDISTKQAKASDLPAIKFDYKPSPLKIIDNGHTVQVNYAPGSSIDVGGSRYELVQFHFHKPSEEKIDGKRYDMVAHLVHKDSSGTLAVIAVPLNRGADNKLIDTLWANLPKEKGKEKEAAAVTINVEDLLPAKRGYYDFEGSLTTPPCSEGVRWMVLKDSSSISGKELAAFSKLYPMNARPVQALNGREVQSSQ